jgi:hypothetical protein
VNGYPPFIELTEKTTGKPVIVGLLFVRAAVDDDDGGTVLYFDNEACKVGCRESYEDVRLMLLHAQPPEQVVNAP